MQRQWTLFMVPFCHVDIGYSNTQDDVLKLHKLNLDGKTNRKCEKVGVLDLIEQTEDYPENSRFKFTSECSWPVYEFLNDDNIPQERKEKLVHHMQKGDIEVCAFLIGHTNRFMGPEMLLRSTSFACEVLKQRYNIPVTSAMLNDVGDASGIVPALSSSGVNYFFYGPNSLHYTLPPLFYLKSPSGGDEKILVWLPPGMYGYGENTDLGLRPPPPLLPFFPHNPDAPLPDYETKIFKLLHWLENNGTPLEGSKKKKNWGGLQFDYPYDAYLIPYYPAHAGDNGHQDRTPSDIAKRWNEKHDNPKMKIATLSEFYRHLEENYGEGIPEHRLDFTGFWGEQMFFPMHHIDAKKMPAIRNFEKRILGAEKFYSFLKTANKGLLPLNDRMQDAFMKAILMTDHNPCPVSFSGNKHPSNSSGIPYTEKDVHIWKETKQAWLDELEESTQLLARSAAENLSSLVRVQEDGIHVLVTNPLSWTRTDVATVNITVPFSAFNIVRADTNESVPVQILETTQKEPFIGTFAFLAKDVPALGYTVYKTVPQDNLSVTEITETNDASVENSFYKLELKPCGRQLSLRLVDSETSAVLFDHDGNENFIRPLFVARREVFGGGIIFPLPPFLVKEEALETLTLSHVEKGPVLTRVILHGKFKKNVSVPFYLSFFTNGFGRVLEGKESVNKINLPETFSCVITLYEHIKRIDFTFTISPSPTQIYELVFPLLFFEKPQSIALETAYQNITLPHDEAKAVPLRKWAISAYNFPFLWIKDYPPDNTFYHYAKFSTGKNNIYFSSRESGTLIINNKHALTGKKASRPGVYHLALGPTFFGDLLIGSATEKDKYEISSMLTTETSGHASASGERLCMNYQEPLAATVFQKTRNEKAILPLSMSFISINNENVALTAFKESENGNGFLLRLYEFSGKHTEVTVTLHFNTPFSASFISSETQHDLPVRSDNSFTLILDPYALKTVKITFHEGDKT